MNNNEKCCCTEYIEKDEMLKICCENEIYSVYGKLNKGEKIILKYFGKLLPTEESDEKQIFLNYGYGNLWSDKNIVKMNKCKHSEKNCYCVELELLNVENLFFCFMDNSNNWDLNDCSSYFITIDTPITTLSKTTVAVTVPDEEYMSVTSNFFQKVTTKLLTLFGRIGNLFSKKVKV